MSSFYSAGNDLSQKEKIMIPDTVEKEQTKLSGHSSR
jgi:hypothetical protein